MLTNNQRSGISPAGSLVLCGTNSETQRLVDRRLVQQGVLYFQWPMLLGDAVVEDLNTQIGQPVGRFYSRLPAISQYEWHIW